MAIIKCPECGGNVSDQAKNCPHCGYELNNLKTEGQVENDGVWRKSGGETLGTQSEKVQKNHNGDISSSGKNVLGVLSVIFGVIGLISFSIPRCVVGIVVGIIADKKHKNRRSQKIGVIISVIAFAISLIVSQVQPYMDKNKEQQAQEVSVDTSKNNDTDSSANSEKKKKKDKQKKTEKPKATKKPKTSKQIKKEYIKSCKTYSYKKVLRNPDKYIGKKVKVKLKISSVHEKGLLTPTKYYFANAKDTYGWYGNMYGVYEKRDSENPKLLEGDIIEVYGEIAEPEETTSLIVNSSEIFTIDMKYVKLISGK